MLGLSQTTFFYWPRWMWIRTTELFFLHSVSYHFLWDYSRNKTPLYLSYSRIRPSGITRLDFMCFTKELILLLHLNITQLGANKHRRITKKLCWKGKNIHLVHMCKDSLLLCRFIVFQDQAMFIWSDCRIIDLFLLLIDTRRLPALTLMTDTVDLLQVQ